MPDISFSIVVFPVIALSLDILLYFILLQKIIPKILFKQYVLTLILLGFLFNIAWEILQIPLFEGGAYTWSHIIFCILAALVDAIMVLLLYFGFSILYKNVLWIQNLNLSRIIFLILTGGIGAVLAETWYLSTAIWSYADSMPLIPIMGAGLSPVSQFMVLPLLIYVLSFKMVRYNYLKAL